MQPNQNAPTITSPQNPYMQQLGPPESADPLVVVKSPTGEEVSLGQRGKSGTYIFNGIITREEYNSDLMRWEALKNYDIMRRSDATVRATLKVCKLPILSATWTIEAATDEQKDIDIAEFVRNQLFESNITFPDLLNEIMTFLDFGYSVFEKVWDYVDYNGKTYIGLKDMQSRKQRSIYRWETNTENPTFGITQYVPGGTYSVPGEKLVIFTNDKEGENYEGISMLRAAYKHWKMKDTLELIDAIRHERQGLGIILITPPEGANESDINDAIDNARQARASEEAVIKKPNGWEIEWMDMKAGATNITDIMGSLDYHKREILKSVLAQFLELGGNKGASGSRATSQDHSALFELAEEFTAKYVGNVFNKEVIKELVDLNFSDVEHYPTLEHSKIGDDNLNQIGLVVNQLMSVGAITPDPEFEQWIRQALHAPDLPEDVRDNYADTPLRKQAAPTPPIAPTQPDGEQPKPDDGENTNKTASVLDEARTIRQKLIDTLVS